MIKPNVPDPMTESAILKYVLGMSKSGVEFTFVLGIVKFLMFPIKLFKAATTLGSVEN